jgi:hypothetical protein
MVARWFFGAFPGGWFQAALGSRDELLGAIACDEADRAHE